MKVGTGIGGWLDSVGKAARRADSRSSGFRGSAAKSEAFPGGSEAICCRVIPPSIGAAHARV